MNLSELKRKLAKHGVGEVADRAQVSRMTVLRVASGKSVPNMGTFERLCRAVAGRRSPPKVPKAAR